MISIRDSLSFFTKGKLKAAVFGVCWPDHDYDLTEDSDEPHHLIAYRLNPNVAVQLVDYRTGEQWESGG